MSALLTILQLQNELERKLHENKNHAQAKQAKQLIGDGWVAFPCYDFGKKGDGEFYWYVCPKDFYEKTGKVEEGHAFDGIKLKGLEEVADHVLFANNGDDGVESLKKYGFEIIGYPEEIVGKEKAFKPIKKTSHASTQINTKNNNVTFSIECTVHKDNIAYLLNILSVLEIFGQQGHTGNLIAGIDGDGNFRPKFSWDKSLFDKKNIAYREYPKNESDYEVLEPKVKLIEKTTHSR